MRWRGIIGVAAVGLLLAAPAWSMDNMSMPHGHGDMKGGHGAHGGTEMETMGDPVFSGKVGPWTGEARLVDMKAQMEKSGVSAKVVAKLPASHHLVVILTDPKTGKPASGVAGTAEDKGPDKASSSKVTLVVMGGHIGADVNMPKAGKYIFRVNVEGEGRKGSAEFPYELKK